VNVTLLFSDPHYLRTALGERLQRRARAGSARTGPPSSPPSRKG